MQPGSPGENIQKSMSFGNGQSGQFPIRYTGACKENNLFRESPTQEIEEPINFLGPD